MASFSAQVRNWSEKAKRNADLVCRASIQDVSELASIAKDGVVRGAPFEIGVVPVDLGGLVGSLDVSINGSTTGSGDAGSGTPPDYAAALVGFELGDTVKVSYNTPYALRVEYGFSGTDKLGRTYNQPGRLMVKTAIQNWQQIVDSNAALFKD